MVPIVKSLNAVKYFIWNISRDRHRLGDLSIVCNAVE